MAKGRFSGCFDLRLSRLRRDSRAAQHDRFEKFFEEIDFPELWKSNCTTNRLSEPQGICQIGISPLLIPRLTASVRLPACSLPRMELM